MCSLKFFYPSFPREEAAHSLTPFQGFSSFCPLGRGRREKKGRKGKRSRKTSRKGAVKRRIFVYDICLIRISASVSERAKKIPTINIDRVWYYRLFLDMWAPICTKFHKLLKLILFLSVTFFFTQVEELLVAANTSFSASSSRYPLTPQDSILSGNKTWCAEFDDDMQYLEIDLMRNSYITEIITQGAVNEEAWVEKYTVSYGHSGDVWKQNKESGSLKVMCTKL